MNRNFRDKMTFSGFSVLGIGLVLLGITFVCAIGFLSEALPILTSQDLAQTFGETLAPLVAASIRVMYLGVMGWIGSLVTIRGVTIMANVPKSGTTESQPLSETKLLQAQPNSKKEKAQTKQTTQPETEPEAKVGPGEPDLIVIPPEELKLLAQKS